jgi:hypothetical protein
LADYIKNPRFKFFFAIVLIVSLVVIGGFTVSAFQPISIPLEVKEAIEILDYPSYGFSFFAGENITFEITVQNLASVTHFVEFDFQLNDPDYQTKYVTFSNYNYSVPTGTQTLSAWVKVAQTAPPANLMLTISRKTDTTAASPSTAPVIDSVSPISTDRLQTIVIKGSGFGDTQPQLMYLEDGSVNTVGGGRDLPGSGNTPVIQVHNDVPGYNYWQAGVRDSPQSGACVIGIILVKWSDTEIVLGGFGAALDSYSRWSLNVGDPMRIVVITSGGKAEYRTTVVAGSEPPPPSGEAPVIDSVSPITTSKSQRIVIQGSGFGNTQPTLLYLDDGSVDTVWGGSTPSIVIYDLTNKLSAGAAGDWDGFTNGPPDLIGITLVSWTDTEIILDGFGTDLSGRFSWSEVQKGDIIQVQIQTIGGIGTYNIEVT